MIEGFLTTEEVCEAFTISKRTLARWRKNFNFPDPVTINGRTVRYSEDDITYWVECQRDKNEEHGLSCNTAKGYR